MRFISTVIYLSEAMNINVNYLGRLGNNMFQYAFTALVLAEICKKECRDLYVAKSIPITGQLERIVDKNAQLVDRAAIDSCSEHVTYARYPVTYNITDYGSMEGKILSIDEISSRPFGFGTTYNFDGFFQHKSYYEGKRDFLKSLFSLPKTKDVELDTAIHIRLTDYKEINWTLPESYYDNAIRQAAPTNLSVFTDEPSHQYIQKLRANGAKIICGEPVNDLGLMSSHKKVIISRSSYSWWGAVLSDAKIFYPKPSKGFWSKEIAYKDVAIQDSNFIFIDC